MNTDWSAVDRVLDECTAGLKHDPELRLDARQELRAHIEEAVANRVAAGKPEPESLSEALQAFGSPLDVAGELAAANRPRLRLRAAARLAAGALIAPLAIAVALFAVLSVARLQVAFSAMVTGIGGQTGRLPAFVLRASAFLEDRFGPKLTPDQQLILKGDTTQSCPIARQRAIWEAHPDDKVYYGHYMTRLIASRSGTLTPQERRELETALETGNRLEPDNARYSYALANTLLREAADIETTNTLHFSAIRDRALLDRAMAELLNGTTKPFATTHARDMLVRRLAVLPPARSLVEQTTRIGIAAGALLPDAAIVRHLARASVAYARLLIAEGRRDEAIRYLEAWRPLARHTLEGGWTLIETLVAYGVIGIGAKEAAPMLTELDPAAGERAGRQAADLLQIQNAWKARRSENPSPDNSFKHGGILMTLVLPATDELVSVEDMAPSRWIDYANAERIVASLFGLVCAISIMGMCLVAWRWRFSRGMTSAPLLILPDWRGVVRILGLSVVAPLALYYLYTRHSGLAGRAYAIHYLWPRFAVEVVLLGGAMYVLAVLLCARAVRRRCGELGLETPSRVSVARLAALSLIPTALFFRLLAGRRYGLFKGSLARSLIPVFAAVTLLATLATRPYLDLMERRLIAKDTLMRPPPAGGFTVIEARLVDRLRNETLAVFERHSREAETPPGDH